jgi:signal transduction histidine kinase/ligand-binding sensor domain-containing protein
MLYTRKQVFILITTFFFFLFGTAQEKYRAVHWGLDEGLSQGETYHMIKDVNGFLWIGTRYGLNRFDGNTFKVYLPQRNNNKSIIDDHVIGGLVEDSLHNIWIGADHGLSRYNIKTDDFTNFFPSASPFWATKTDVLCVEGDSLIVSYNIYTAAKKILANLQGFENAFVGPSATYSVFDSSTNSVWCLLQHPQGKAVLLEISLSTNNKFFFTLPHYSKSNFFDAECFCYDAGRKCFWINGNEGLLQFTLDSKQFHHIKALDQYEQLKDYGRYVGITIDKQGSIWFATHPRGMIIYDPDDESVSFPFLKDSVLQIACSDANACLYCDRDSVMWSGSWLRKGIYQIVPFSPVVKNYVSSPKKDSLNGYPVVGAVHAGNGKIWIGTGNGIHILNKTTNTFQALQKKDLPGIKMTGDFIGTIGIDTIAQKAWLGTNGGVFKADILTGKCTPVIFKKLNNEIVHPAFRAEFDGGEIFLTAADDKSQSVFVLNLNSDTAHQILSFSGSPFNIVYTVPVENHFLFLYGNINENSNQTYENKNGTWRLIHTPVDSIRWTSIAYIKEDNTYWVAGDNQLFHFDKNFHIVQTYSKDNGLSELTVTGLINDNNGNIWFHTDRSIQELNVKTGQITTMSEKDGFEKQDFELLPFVNKDKEGNIYYGGGVFGIGLTKINPLNFVSTTSSVYLKSLTINQNPFALKESINNTDTLLLKYNQTKIALDAGIIDFYSQGKSLMRYKLENNSLNEGWQYAPYYYTIRYEGLKPGNYRLIIQASNASNEFNGTEKVLLINISPPFWSTWWFRIAAAIFLVATVYSFIQYRYRKLRERNVALEEKVLHRTKELKHSLEDLRETQKQLIQSEKMASLGELTAGIAHEIQNPLNFVNNFSEINKELVDELKTELATGNVQLVNEIADNIKENELKINHHGKRADAIVKGMLQHSRSSSGVKEPTNINALADEYLRLAYHGLRAKDKSFNATMKTDFDQSIGSINIIQQDMGRVILNLINNAFYVVDEKKKQSQNASPDDTIGHGYEPTVSVSTNKINGKIEIKVRDNGNGIPQKVLDKIFQPFFTTKPTGQGTGLGLSLSYDIIKVHGGELNVETKDGEGSTFTIVLPAK